MKHEFHACGKISTCPYCNYCIASEGFYGRKELMLSCWHHKKAIYWGDKGSVLGCCAALYLSVNFSRIDGLAGHGWGPGTVRGGSLVSDPLSGSIIYTHPPALPRIYRYQSSDDEQRIIHRGCSQKATLCLSKSVVCPVRLFSWLFSTYPKKILHHMQDYTNEWFLQTLNIKNLYH